MWCKSPNSYSILAAKVIQLHTPSYAQGYVEIAQHDVSALPCKCITAILTYSVESETLLTAQNYYMAKSQLLNSAGLPSSLSGLSIFTFSPRRFLDQWLAITALRPKPPRIEHAIFWWSPGLTPWWLDPHWPLRQSFAETGPGQTNPLHSLTSLLVYSTLVLSTRTSNSNSTPKTNERFKLLTLLLKSETFFHWLNNLTLTLRNLKV